jgi:ribosomal RNA-processing protein 8
MFAVPGWSVSADSLKAEAAVPADNQPSASKPVKKRKRAGGQQQQLEDVDSSSVGDLWASVVEGKKGSDGAASSQKRQKTGEAGASVKPESKQAADPAASSKKKDKEQKKRDKKAKKENDDKKSVKSAPAEDTEDSVPAAAAAAAAPATVLPAPPAPKLTPLQASMRQKLISARFRHLNETLYTRPSEEAFSLFQESPEMFDEYHEGFRQQVKVWPENPVSSFLKDVRTREVSRRSLERVAVLEDVELPDWLDKVLEETGVTLKGFARFRVGA